MKTWHELDATAQGFAHATLRRAAAQHERLFYDSTDPSAKRDASRRRTALLAAADYLNGERPATLAPPRYTGSGSLSDSQAVERIAHWLRDPDWGVGMLEDIAEIIAATGRDIEGDGSPTWDRH